ncbi:MAG: SRPBCC domain-containing protein, partial [Myxococcales bacterium]|nr:SRPBCC domain-containing protein [Myxococcales bacterium]
TMHGPDGTDYPNVTLYHEVERHEKLVYDHGATDETAPLFRVVATFRAVDGGTELDLRMILASAEAAAETRAFVKKAGGESTWDRLAEYLQERVAGREVFVVNRTFAAPRALMFALWTEPEHLAQWLPPTGFRMELLRADIRTGGSSFYRMFDDNGVEMFGAAAYEEVSPPTRLVYTQQFRDREERLSRHPMAPTFPATMRTTVQFWEETPEITRLTVTWEPAGEVTPEEHAMFLAMRPGMTLGWTGSFDKLEALL